LKELINIKKKIDFLNLLREKLTEASKRKQELKKDLFFFFDQPEFVEDFIGNFDFLAMDFLKAVEKSL